jgi:hypothetical protein
MQMGLVQVSVQFPGIPVTILEVLYVAFGGRPYKISHLIYTTKHLSKNQML